jgi:hypothetical protein
MQKKTNKTALIRSHVAAHTNDFEMLTDHSIIKAIKEAHGITVSKTLIWSAAGAYYKRITVFDQNAVRAATTLISQFGGLKPALAILKIIAAQHAPSVSVS